MTFIKLYTILINLTAFFAMGADKRRSIRHRWRIPERRLLLLALLGGSAGEALGMLLFRHKIRSRLFALGVPALLVIHILILLFL